MDGLLNLDEFAELTGIDLPEGPYETVAGYLLAALGHLPGEGESAEVLGRRLTVTELDGRRISRVRVSAVRPAVPAGRRPPTRPGNDQGGPGNRRPGRPGERPTKLGRCRAISVPDRVQSLVPSWWWTSGPSTPS